MRTVRITSTMTLLLSLLLSSPSWLRAQNAVNVTIEAGDASLRPGESTTVTVYGQIDAAIEADSDRIFSWYIDVLNDGGDVARGFMGLSTPASDNNVETSGDGTPEGFNLRGIYDTFLDHPGAGKGSRVVLVQFDVIAVGVGTANFSVAPGTTVGSLSDFLVARTGGGGFTGGVYGGASVAITVEGVPEVNHFVNRVGDEVEVTFDPAPGFDHVVQFTDDLRPPVVWTELPGGPHNLGVVNQTVPGVVRRFYRICLTPQ